MALTGFDQAQSPRLGQPVPIESTTVRMFTGEEIPEAAWAGQVIFRTDTQTMQVFNGIAWEDVVGGNFGQLTFVGPDAPTAGMSAGDLWFNTTTLIWYFFNPTANAWMPGKLSYGVDPPSAPSAGEAWYNPHTKVLQYWNGTAWVLGTASTAPGVYTGGLPSSATLGSAWTDSEGIVWVCISAYTSGGTLANWQRAAYHVDPLAGLINGTAIVARERSTSPMRPQSSTSATTGLIWLDIQPDSGNLGKIFIYNGTVWKQVIAPNTVDLCLAVLIARHFIQWCNTDFRTATINDTAVAIRLSHLPITESIIIKQNGIALNTLEWTISGNVVTVSPSSGVTIRVGDHFEAYYAYTSTDAVPLNPTLVGVTSPGVANISTWPNVWTTFAMPTGTAAGDLLVLTARGGNAPGGGESMLSLSCSDGRMTLAHYATQVNGHTIAEAVWVGIADGTGLPIVVNGVSDPGLFGGSAGVLAAFHGVNGWNAISSSDAGSTTPTISGTAAVAATSNRGSSFSFVNAGPPDGYTLAGSTGFSYSSTALSWWYDAAAVTSPVGTYTGEMCCIIEMV